MILATVIVLPEMLAVALLALVIFRWNRSSTAGFHRQKCHIAVPVDAVVLGNAAILVVGAEGRRFTVHGGGLVAVHGTVAGINYQRQLIVTRYGLQPR